MPVFTCSICRALWAHGSTTTCGASCCEGLNVSFYFGGTSLLIVVGVAMDTVQQIEAQLVMRNYEGFVKKGKLRGRRYG